MSSVRYEIPADARPSRCRGCNAVIYWINTPAGKRMPVNPAGDPHWATCPRAKEFKKGEDEMAQPGKNSQTPPQGTSTRPSPPPAGGQTQAPSAGQELAQKELSASERFMNMVIREFSAGVGEIALTAFQKRLAQNYFIALDAELKKAETKRLKKAEKNRDPLPIIWANVNMEALARSVVAAARIGLDPACENHVAMMPFKNNALGKYDIVFIDGYRGLELKAKKYGMDTPDAVIVELVHENDRFIPHKKDAKNPVESYEFEIVNPFDRGRIVGGFYYHLYRETPEKNRLVIMSYEEILKRRPRYASVEFWGGEKDIWENGKVVGQEHVEGWHEFMCWKTLYRAAYRSITIDSQKIDDDYMRLKQIEAEYEAAEAEREIQENANSQTIDVSGEVVSETVEPVPEAEAPRAPAQADTGPQISKPAAPAGGPGF